MSNYVVGFMFDPSFQRVVLIRKSRPKWQAGLLNGVGGHIEEGEAPIEAMLREFSEETGVQTTKEQWRHFLVMGDHYESGWTVKCFCCTGLTLDCRTKTDEPVSVYDITTLHAHRAIENLHWIIPLAIDHLMDGRPHFVDATYPG
jgi:8-oxo-dGTP diphosphatase